MIDPSHTDRSIGIVVSCRVQPGQAASFEEGLRELIRVAARQPGAPPPTCCAARPARAGGVSVVYRFADEATLHRRYSQTA
jgi:antibiotic biosynthesis monooxygenase (ABM) superfamily enzyme